MKKIFRLGLVLVFIAVTLPALAAGKLVATQENLYIIPYYSTSVYCNFYAELTNNGDKPVEFSSGLLELYDTDGNTIASTDIYYCYPMVLQPGENGYVVSSQYTDLPENATIDDHMLSITGKGKVSQKIDRLEASALLETQSDSYYSATCTTHHFTVRIQSRENERSSRPKLFYARPKKAGIKEAVAFATGFSSGNRRGWPLRWYA